MSVCGCKGVWVLGMCVINLDQSKKSVQLGLVRHLNVNRHVELCMWEASTFKGSRLCVVLVPPNDKLSIVAREVSMHANASPAAKLTGPVTGPVTGLVAYCCANAPNES